MTRFRRVPVLVLTLAGALTAISGTKAVATGIYDDVAGETAFLIAPGQATLSGRVIAARGDQNDASLYGLAARFPLRSYFLLELWQPYVSRATASGVETGFADLVVRLRARVWGTSARGVSLVLGVGTGTGNTRLFPYSAQSLDLHASLAYVDSLPLAQVWVAAGGTSVKREPEGLDDTIVHTDYLRATAGVVVPFPPEMDLRLGAWFARYDNNALREIYLAELGWAASPELRLAAGVHVETGWEPTRVGDYAVFTDVTVHF